MNKRALPRDLETLIKEDVLRRALSSHIEEGYLQAEGGQLIDGAQARREIQTMKDNLR